MLFENTQTERSEKGTRETDVPYEQKFKDASRSREIRDRMAYLDAMV